MRGRQIYAASTAVFRHSDTNQWSEMNRDLNMRVGEIGMYDSILCVQGYVLYSVSYNITLIQVKI